MLYVFIIIKKHVYTCKKRDFKACARCSYDPVITTHGRQYAIAAFRRYSVYDDMFFFLSEKHVYACKKRDFNAGTRCSSSYVTA